MQTELESVLRDDAAALTARQVTQLTTLASQLGGAALSVSNIEEKLQTALRQALDLPADKFGLQVQFVDRDSATPGLQPGLTLKLDVDKTVRESVELSLVLGDQGPLVVEPRGNVTVDAQTKLDLDFGINLANSRDLLPAGHTHRGDGVD